MIHLAIIGTGGMANVHASHFSKFKGCKVIAGCDVDATRALEFTEKHEIPHAFSDVGEMFKSCKIDAVSIVTPDAFHAPLALKAIAAGKHVLCEKPLALNYPDAQQMAAAAKRKGVINMVNFSYRNSSAIQKAHALVSQGAIGVPVHVEASYLQSWLSSKVWGDWRTTPAWLWRQSSEHGSKGVLGDVGVHILDFAGFPVGEFKSINARLKTFTEHKGAKQGGYPLDANDSAIITAEFKNGALATIHTTRWATGHQNSLDLAIFGTKGAIRINLDKSQSELRICKGKNVDTATWEEIECPATPNIYERFFKSVRTGKNDQPDFARGAAIQKVLDACFDSNETGNTITV